MGPAALVSVRGSSSARARPCTVMRRIADAFEFEPRIRADSGANLCTDDRSLTLAVSRGGSLRLRTGSAHWCGGHKTRQDSGQDCSTHGRRYYPTTRVAWRRLHSQLEHCASSIQAAGFASSSLGEDSGQSRLASDSETRVANAHAHSEKSGLPRAAAGPIRVRLVCSAHMRSSVSTELAADRRRRRAWGVSGHGNHRVFRGLETGQFWPFWWPVSYWKGPCFPVVGSPAVR